MCIMRFKKGVSPLIATVLLLAFAVSVATIVVQLEPFKAGCGSFQAEISKNTDGGYKICYDEAQRNIEMFMINKEFSIDNMKISIIGNKEIFTKDIEIDIPPNTPGKIVIPYEVIEYGQPEQFVINPFYRMENGEIEDTCAMHFDIHEIENCR